MEMLVPLLGDKLALRDPIDQGLALLQLFESLGVLLLKLPQLLVENGVFLLELCVLSL
jgi:hypothetical protein